MIFTQKIYKRPVAEMILDGTKTCTRRLVKEGEFSMTSSGIPECNVIPMTVFKTKGLFESKRIKWQVGRDYAVQLGGKAGLWYCSNCKKIWNDRKASYLKNKKLVSVGLLGCDCTQGKYGPEPCKTLKSLRVKITGIRKERLLDISESDAKKEGFKNKDEFIQAFRKIVKTNQACFYDNIYGFPDKLEVWVLDFSVK